MRTVLAALAVAAASPALADEGLRDLCPDRPGKSTSACTVDEGHFQLESDILNASFQRSGGVTTDTWFVTNPNLKYGVGDDFDVEADLAPLVIVRTHDASTGRTQVLSGIGDLVLRAKWAAIGNSGSDFALALDPFLKLPTARTGIGNGAVEGGLVAPFAFALADGWQIGSTPEVDALKDNIGQGRHANVVDVVSVGRAIDSVTLGAEVWEDTNFDPAATTQAWSFDLTAAWVPNAETQLDAGINFGLDRNTPGLQLYTGISRRF